MVTGVAVAFKLGGRDGWLLASGRLLELVTKDFLQFFELWWDVGATLTLGRIVIPIVLMVVFGHIKF